MALVLRFSFAAQVIAAFVIFVLGYIGLFATLLLGLLVAKVLYEALKWIYARTAESRARVPSRFPQSAGGQSERRIPLSSTQLVNNTPHAEIRFHPALDRRRISQIIS
jgi:hypothetical protein